MASYSEKEIADLIKQAEAQDAEAMYLLSQINKRGTDGKRDLDFREYWFQKAREAGHPIARFLRYPTPETPPMEERVKAAEAAARHGAGGDIALSVGLGYALPVNAPSGFEFLPEDPVKARYWLTFAAERGNAEAISRLCTASYFGNERHYGVKKNHKEAVRWCSAVALVECSRSAASFLAEIYRKGEDGVPRDLVESRYWQRLGEERWDRELNRPAKKPGN